MISNENNLAVCSVCPLHAIRLVMLWRSSDAQRAMFSMHVCLYQPHEKPFLDIISYSRMVIVFASCTAEGH
jgi:hypothetical protein